MYKYLVIIAMTLLSGALPAQKAITLEEAKSMAMEQNIGYRAGEAARKSAEWQKVNAFSAFLPNLSLSGSLLYMDPAREISMGAQSVRMNNDMRTFSLNLSQPLFLGGKLYQSYKIASTSQEITDLSQEAKRFELLSGVESRFYSLLQLQELLNIGRAELERARNNLDLAEIKLLNGLITRADKLRFQANLANKEIALMQSKTAFDLALRDFANYLGSEELLVPTAPETNANQILPFAELSEADTEQFLSALRRLGKRDNLQLKVIGKSLELSERAYKIAKGGFLPSLNLVGSRSWEENGIDRYQFEASNQIMLNLSVPLLPQAGNYAAMRKAFFDAQQASMEARQASEGIVLGLEAAAMKMLSSARQVNAAKLSLELTQDMYDQLDERYRLNMISTIELMDAELMLSTAKMGYTNAYYDFFKARLDLLSMLGTDDLGILTALLEK